MINNDNNIYYTFTQDKISELYQRENDYNQLKDSKIKIKGNDIIEQNEEYQQPIDILKQGQNQNNEQLDKIAERRKILQTEN